MMIDWDDAFQNGAYIGGAADYPSKWAFAATGFRGSHPNSALAQSYGPKARNLYDLFLPDAAPKGVFIFVHGGYWLQFDRSSWSHLAAGALAHGWAVAFVQYTLAPDAKISQITAEVGAAITEISNRIDGPIRLAGHSAGGHLVARMNCRNAPLSPEVTARIARVTAISGVLHLPPLRHTGMNEQLLLSEAEAIAESPVLLPPRQNTKTSFWVGATERPEFLRQTRMCAENWARQGADVTDIYAPNEHHFSVIEPLADPNSPLMKEILR